MEKSYQSHLQRIDRLMEIINAPDPYPFMGHLWFEDIVVFTCQCMWHLKDWIFNDVEFGVKNPEQLSADIHAEKCLLICADLANGSKHLKLHSPKTDCEFADRTGIHFDTKEGIFQHFYYIISTDTDGPYHGKEIRDVLAECRTAWNRIIDEHFLSNIEL